MCTPCYFSNVPDVVLRNILGELDFKSILILRKTSHDLRNFIDDDKSEFNLDKIDVTVKSESVTLSLSHGEKLARIKYQKEENGCEVICSDKKKLIDAEDYMKVFHKDFQVILRHQNLMLKEFSLFFVGDSMTPEKSDQELELIFSEFLTDFKKTLTERNRLLQAESFTMMAFGQDQVLQILPYFDPKPLKKLQLRNARKCGRQINVDEIVKLNQWKQAEELYLSTFDLVSTESIQHFGHFLKCKIVLVSVNSEVLLQMKNALLHAPNFKRFTIAYTNFDDQEHLLEIFGQPVNDRVHHGTRCRNWIFQIPGSNRSLSVQIFSEFLIEFSCILSLSVSRN